MKRQESVDRSLRTEKTSLKFMTKLIKIPYSFFLFFFFCGIILIKFTKDSKRKNQMEITLFS